MKAKLIIYLLIFVSVFISCSKDELSTMKEFYECHNSQNYDSNSIANKLIGTWHLKSSSCFWSGKTTIPEKTTMAFFTPTKFFITENSVVISEGNWGLEVEDENYWGIESDSSTMHLAGKIVFCDDQVIFAASYRDLCDHLYEKVK